MSTEMILSVLLAIVILICIAGVWAVRRLLKNIEKNIDVSKPPFFAPYTENDAVFWHHLVILFLLLPILAVGMYAFGLSHAWIRPVSEITKYNGSYAELWVPGILFGAIVVARYVSPIRVVFFLGLIVLVAGVCQFLRDVANVNWDSSEPVPFSGTIVKKQGSSGSNKAGTPKDYYFHVAAHPDKTVFEVPVPLETFQVAAVGDSIFVPVRAGYFGKKWASGNVAVAPKARK